MYRRVTRTAATAMLIAFSGQVSWFSATVVRADITITFGDLVPTGATMIVGPLYVDGYKIQTLTDSGLLPGSPFDVSSVTTGGGTTQTAGSNPYYAGKVGLQWAQTDLLEITRADGQPFTWTSIGLDEAVDPSPERFSAHAAIYGVTDLVAVSETQFNMIPFSYGFQEYANQQPSISSAAVWIPQGGEPFQIADITLTTDFKDFTATPEPSSGLVVLFFTTCCAGISVMKWARAGGSILSVPRGG